MYAPYLIFAFWLLSWSLPGQDISTNDKWSFNLAFGLEEHDKRLFEFPMQNEPWFLVQERFGTYVYRFGVEQRIGHNSWLNHYAGLSSSVRKYTMTRPFDHSQLSKKKGYVLYWTSKYQVVTLDISWRSRFQVYRNFHFTGSVNGVFDIMKKAESNIVFGPKLNPGFYAIELYGGAGYRLPPFSFDLTWRALNYRKIDQVILPILFRPWTKDDYLDQWGDWYNPLNITLTVRYELQIKEKK